MGRHIKVAFLAAIIVLPALSAQAGIYVDDLSKCLVKSSSDDDKAALMEWMFYAISLHPSVAPYAKIDDKQAQAINRKAGALFQRLTTVDCRTESIAALKYEGVASFQTSFSVLGQIAMRGLLNDPHVAKGIAGLNDGVDSAKFEALFKEAGVQTDAAPDTKSPPQ